MRYGVSVDGETARPAVHAVHLRTADRDEALELSEDARARRDLHEPEEHRFDSYGGSRAAYVSDPDGNVVELWTWDVAGHLEQP